LIAHTAYSEIAAKISDRGIHVVIVSMEPTRMASPRLASLKRIRSIMKQVQRLSPENISSWSIGGHSLGSFQAMRLARPMGASHLVMWGTANFGSLLSNLTEAFDLQVLVIHGSHDKLCAMNDLEYRQFQTTYFPHQTVFTTIQGAAHSWFASTNETKVDLLGESGISMEQHQDEAGEITADFLLQREQNRRK
jgi:dienelactone hydrolase